ncbi:MAG: beta-glucanase (GH16 family) [Verrucomicrobiales bacterium]|jgi:beta-glucanase (GH16 family)
MLSIRWIPVALILCLGTGCERDKLESSRQDEAKEMSQPAIMSDLQYQADSVVWAVNVGGDAYSGVDGIDYVADKSISGGAIGKSSKIIGSQDNPLYTSYRIGNDVRVAKKIPNGIYDLQFCFAEPFDVPVGERVFSVIAQGQPVILDLDVRLARDGKHVSALDRVATGIEVSGGELQISFEALTGEPILSALVVRVKHEDTRSWDLVWRDEFDYEGAPKEEKWSIDVWPARKVNDEDQAYTDRAKNIRVQDGTLIIEAHKEDFDNAQYTSGRIHSRGKGDILYGKVEVRAKLPAGQGSWPAIWMLPSDASKYATTWNEDEDWQGSTTNDAWPNSGEIDIMEHVGYDMHTVHGTVHNKAYYWLHWNQRKGSIEGKTVDTAFHIYTLEWAPDFLTISKDGSPYFTYVNEGTGWEAWPFDHPFHLILNLAVGGMWGRGGGPIDDSIFPARMEVDYVRFYKRTDA